ncbi:hypothetical protein [Fusobacterium necrogenes]|uniref:hypothetical protein n=1 Tax=Fusobacterium necrogenes TaxID=858 RepID=UPI00255CEAC2|nr:hypothetical protein [Fusobacterium necrogenes]
MGGKSVGDSDRNSIIKGGDDKYSVLDKDNAFDFPQREDTGTGDVVLKDTAGETTITPESYTPLGAEPPSSKKDTSDNSGGNEDLYHADYVETTGSDKKVSFDDKVKVNEYDPSEPGIGDATVDKPINDKDINDNEDLYQAEQVYNSDSESDSDTSSIDEKSPEEQLKDLEDIKDLISSKDELTQEDKDDLKQLDDEIRELQEKIQNDKVDSDDDSSSISSDDSIISESGSEASLESNASTENSLEELSERLADFSERLKKDAEEANKRIDELYNKIEKEIQDSAEEQRINAEIEKNIKEDIKSFLDKYFPGESEKIVKDTSGESDSGSESSLSDEIKEFLEKNFPEESKDLIDKYEVLDEDNAFDFPQREDTDSGDVTLEDTANEEKIVAEHYRPLGAELPSSVGKKNDNSLTIKQVTSKIHNEKYRDQYAKLEKIEQSLQKEREKLAELLEKQKELTDKKLTDKDKKELKKIEKELRKTLDKISSLTKEQQKTLDKIDEIRRTDITEDDIVYEEIPGAVFKKDLGETESNKIKVNDDYSQVKDFVPNGSDQNEHIYAEIDKDAGSADTDKNISEEKSVDEQLKDLSDVRDVILNKGELTSEDKENLKQLEKEIEELKDKGAKDEEAIYEEIEDVKDVKKASTESNLSLKDKVLLGVAPGKAVNDASKKFSSAKDKFDKAKTNEAKEKALDAMNKAIDHMRDLESHILDKNKGKPSKELDRLQDSIHEANKDYREAVLKNIGVDLTPQPSAKPVEPPPYKNPPSYEEAIKSLNKGNGIENGDLNLKNNDKYEILNDDNAFDFPQREDNGAGDVVLKDTAGESVIVAENYTPLGVEPPSSSGARPKDPPPYKAPPAYQENQKAKKPLPPYKEPPAYQEKVTKNSNVSESISSLEKKIESLNKDIERVKKIEAITGGDFGTKTSLDDLKHKLEKTEKELSDLQDKALEGLSENDKKIYKDLSKELGNLTKRQEELTNKQPLSAKAVAELNKIEQELKDVVDKLNSISGKNSGSSQGDKYGVLSGDNAFDLPQREDTDSGDVTLKDTANEEKIVAEHYIPLGAEPPHLGSDKKASTNQSTVSKNSKNDNALSIKNVTKEIHNDKYRDQYAKLEKTEQKLQKEREKLTELLEKQAELTNKKLTSKDKKELDKLEKDLKKTLDKINSLIGEQQKIVDKIDEIRRTDITEDDIVYEQIPGAVFKKDLGEVENNKIKINDDYSQVKDSIENENDQEEHIYAEVDVNAGPAYTDRNSGEEKNTEEQLKDLYDIKDMILSKGDLTPEDREDLKQLEKEINELKGENGDDDTDPTPEPPSRPPQPPKYKNPPSYEEAIKSLNKGSGAGTGKGDVNLSNKATDSANSVNKTDFTTKNPLSMDKVAFEINDDKYIKEYDKLDKLEQHKQKEREKLTGLLDKQTELANKKLTPETKKELNKLEKDIKKTLDKINSLTQDQQKVIEKIEDIRRKNLTEEDIVYEEIPGVVFKKDVATNTDNNQEALDKYAVLDGANAFDLPGDNGERAENLKDTANESEIKPERYIPLGAEPQRNTEKTLDSLGKQLDVLQKVQSQITSKGQLGENDKKLLGSVEKQAQDIIKKIEETLTKNPPKYKNPPSYDEAIKKIKSPDKYGVLGGDNAFDLPNSNEGSVTLKDTANEPKIIPENYNNLNTKNETFNLDNTGDMSNEEYIESVKQDVERVQKIVEITGGDEGTEAIFKELNQKLDNALAEVGQADDSMLKGLSVKDQNRYKDLASDLAHLQSQQVTLMKKANLDGNDNAKLDKIQDEMETIVEILNKLETKLSDTRPPVPPESSKEKNTSDLGKNTENGDIDISTERQHPLFSTRYKHLDNVNSSIKKNEDKLGALFDKQKELTSKDLTSKNKKELDKIEKELAKVSGEMNTLLQEKVKTEDEINKIRDIYSEELGLNTENDLLSGDNAFDFPKDNGERVAIEDTAGEKVVIPELYIPLGAGEKNAKLEEKKAQLEEYLDKLEIVKDIIVSKGNLTSGDKKDLAKIEKESQKILKELNKIIKEKANKEIPSESTLARTESTTSTDSNFSTNSELWKDKNSKSLEDLLSIQDKISKDKEEAKSEKVEKSEDKKSKNPFKNLFSKKTDGSSKKNDKNSNKNAIKNPFASKPKADREGYKKVGDTYVKSEQEAKRQLDLALDNPNIPKEHLQDFAKRTFLNKGIAGPEEGKKNIVTERITNSGEQDQERLKILYDRIGNDFEATRKQMNKEVAKELVDDPRLVGLILGEALNNPEKAKELLDIYFINRDVALEEVLVGKYIDGLGIDEEFVKNISKIVDEARGEVFENYTGEKYKAPNLVFGNNLPGITGIYSNGEMKIDIRQQNGVKGVLDILLHEGTHNEQELIKKGVSDKVSQNVKDLYGINSDGGYILPADPVAYKKQPVEEEAFDAMKAEEIVKIILDKTVTSLVGDINLYSNKDFDNSSSDFDDSLSINSSLSNESQSKDLNYYTQKIDDMLKQQEDIIFSPDIDKEKSEAFKEKYAALREEIGDILGNNQDIMLTSKEKEKLEDMLEKIERIDDRIVQSQSGPLEQKIDVGNGVIVLTRSNKDVLDNLKIVADNADKLPAEHLESYLKDFYNGTNEQALANKVKENIGNGEQIFVSKGEVEHDKASLEALKKIEAVLEKKKGSQVALKEDNDETKKSKKKANETPEVREKDRNNRNVITRSSKDVKDNLKKVAEVSKKLPPEHLTDYLGRVVLNSDQKEINRNNKDGESIVKNPKLDLDAEVAKNLGDIYASIYDKSDKTLNSQLDKELVDKLKSNSEINDLLTNNEVTKENLEKLAKTVASLKGEIFKDLTGKPYDSVNIRIKESNGNTNGELQGNVLTLYLRDGANMVDYLGTTVHELKHNDQRNIKEYNNERGPLPYLYGINSDKNGYIEPNVDMNAYKDQPIEAEAFQIQKEVLAVFKDGFVDPTLIPKKALSTKDKLNLKLNPDKLVADATKGSGKLREDLKNSFGEGAIQAGIGKVRGDIENLESLKKVFLEKNKDGKYNQQIKDLQKEINDNYTAILMAKKDLTSEQNKLAEAAGGESSIDEKLYVDSYEDIDKLVDRSLNEKLKEYKDRLIKELGFDSETVNKVFKEHEKEMGDYAKRYLKKSLTGDPTGIISHQEIEQNLDKAFNDELKRVTGKEQDIRGEFVRKAYADGVVYERTSEGINKQLDILAKNKNIPFEHLQDYLSNMFTHKGPDEAFKNTNTKKVVVDSTHIHKFGEKGTKNLKSLYDRIPNDFESTRKEMNSQLVSTLGKNENLNNIVAQALGKNIENIKKDFKKNSDKVVQKLYDTDIKGVNNRVVEYIVRGVEEGRREIFESTTGIPYTESEIKISSDVNARGNTALATHNSTDGSIEISIDKLTTLGTLLDTIMHETLHHEQTLIANNKDKVPENVSDYYKTQLAGYITPYDDTEEARGFYREQLIEKEAFEVMNAIDVLKEITNNILGEKSEVDKLIDKELKNALTEYKDVLKNMYPNMKEEIDIAFKENSKEISDGARSYLEDVLKEKNSLPSKEELKELLDDAFVVELEKWKLKEQEEEFVRVDEGDRTLFLRTPEGVKKQLGLVAKDKNNIPSEHVQEFLANTFLDKGNKESIKKDDGNAVITNSSEVELDREAKKNLSSLYSKLDNNFKDTRDNMNKELINDLGKNKKLQDFILQGGKVDVDFLKLAYERQPEAVINSIYDMNIAGTSDEMIQNIYSAIQEGRKEVFEKALDVEYRPSDIVFTTSSDDSAEIASYNPKTENVEFYRDRADSFGVALDYLLHESQHHEQKIIANAKGTNKIPEGLGEKYKINMKGYITPDSESDMFGWEMYKAQPTEAEAFDVMKAKDVINSLVQNIISGTNNANQKNQNSNEQKFVKGDKEDIGAEGKLYGLALGKPKRPEEGNPSQSNINIETKTGNSKLGEIPLIFGESSDYLSASLAQGGNSGANKSANSYLAVFNGDDGVKRLEELAQKFMERTLTEEDLEDYSNYKVYGSSIDIFHAKDTDENRVSSSSNMDLLKELLGTQLGAQGLQKMYQGMKELQVNPDNQISKEKYKEGMKEFFDAKMIVTLNKTLDGGAQAYIDMSSFFTTDQDIDLEKVAEKIYDEDSDMYDSSEAVMLRYILEKHSGNPNVKYMLEGQLIDISEGLKNKISKK